MLHQRVAAEAAGTEAWKDVVNRRNWRSRHTSHVTRHTSSSEAHASRCRRCIWQLPNDNCEPGVRHVYVAESPDTSEGSNDAAIAAAGNASENAGDAADSDADSL
jgi:hypothetical protein